MLSAAAISSTKGFCMVVSHPGKAARAFVCLAQRDTSDLLCKRCHTHFKPGTNQPRSCKYHPQLFTGGEVSKALGFLRRSDRAEDQLGAVVGRKGIMRFWDCCGKEEEQAEGCEAGYHVTFDDDVNIEHGWL